MESTRPISSNQENEISLKELILKMFEWKNYLQSNLVVILICGLVGAGLGLTYAFLKKPIYVARLTFVLEESKSNPLGSYAGIATQFGIDLGSANGSGVFTGDNILEFLKSRLMVEKALLTPIQIKGKGIKSLADHYLEIEGLRKKWHNESRLNEVNIPLNIQRKDFSLLQDSILDVIQTRIVKENLQVSKPDKKLTFILVECLSKDEMFSKLFTERLVGVATDFYIATKTKRSKANVDKLQYRADSIEVLLNKKTFSAAAEQDLNQNPARKLATVGSEVVSRDKMILQTVYGEVIKNLEISKMSMAQETPVIQIVDTPILPLIKEKTGKIKGLVMGGAFGLMLISLLLILRKLYRTIMAQ